MDRLWRAADTSDCPHPAEEAKSGLGMLIGGIHFSFQEQSLESTWKQ
jgi:hypothetical protein